MGRRTQAERDAMTVEIGYAVASGVLVAAATYCGILLPTLLLDLPDAGDRLLAGAGAVLGALVFVVRVVHVLRHFPHTGEGRRLPAGQPGRPGRTSPDP